MAMAYIKLYYDQLEILEPFSEAEVGRLIRGLLAYAATGEQPKLTGNERFIWNAFKVAVDRDAEQYATKCDKLRENGRSGGKARKANASTQKQMQANASEEEQMQANAFSEKQMPPRQEKEKEKEYYFPLTPQGENDDNDLWLNAALNDQVYQAAEGIELTGTTALQHADRLIADYSAEWVLEAIHRASLAAKSAWSWRYIETILQNWKKSGGIEDRKPVRDEPESPKQKYRWVGDGDDDEKPPMFETFVDERGYERVRLRS